MKRRERKKSKRLILFFLLFSTVTIAILLFFIKETAFASPIDRTKLQRECEGIMGDNPGAILVYDLKTGEPLAIVNPETAFREAFPPGSLFKLVTAAALLEEDLVDPAQRVECRNYFELQGQKYICSEPGGHGLLDMNHALGKSCSIWFYHFAPRLSPDTLTKRAESFGFGKSFESKGTSITPVKGKCSPPQDPRKFLNFAVGDSGDILITPWQAANLTAIIAEKPLSPALKQPSLKKNTLLILRKGMKTAATEGTCKELASAGIDAGAKTGTSTDSRYSGKNHGWFTAFFPCEKPKYVIVVFLEDGRGYIDAVPMGVKVIKRIKLNSK